MRSFGEAVLVVRFGWGGRSRGGEMSAGDFVFGGGWFDGGGLCLSPSGEFSEGWRCDDAVVRFELSAVSAFRVHSDNVGGSKFAQWGAFSVWWRWRPSSRGRFHVCGRALGE